jgi:hypothetical protein
MTGHHAAWSADQFSTRRLLENQANKNAPPSEIFQRGAFAYQGESFMGLVELILLIVIVLLVVSALPAWPYSRSWGYYPSGGLGLLLVVLLLLFLLGPL